jgi:hypothetical protein
MRDFHHAKISGQSCTTIFGVRAIPRDDSMQLVASEALSFSVVNVDHDDAGDVQIEIFLLFTNSEVSCSHSDSSWDAKTHFISERDALVDHSSILLYRHLNHGKYFFVAATDGADRE